MMILWNYIVVVIPKENITSEAGTVGLKASQDLPAGVRPRTRVPLLPRLEENNRLSVLKPHVLETQTLNENHKRLFNKKSANQFIVM